MKELIKITKRDGQQLVDARDLHYYLESSERFSKWFSRMLEYGFIKDVDYTPYRKVHPQNKQIITEYAMTLDMAKELSMLARNEKGKQARRYFIEAEKNLRKIQLPDFSNPAEAAREWALQYEQRKLAESKVKELSPKAEAYDVISNSKKLSGLDEVAKLFDTGRNKLYKWLKRNGYVKKNNVPYQRYVDLGLLDYRVDNVNGRLYYVTLITGKGIKFFQSKYFQN
jgi:anti-repressor protein